MPNLQNLLVILDGQKLSAGYLQPAGSGTALETVRAMKQQFDPYTLLQNPLPGMNNPPVVAGRPQPNLLFSPAWIANRAGIDAIYLDGVDGGLDLSQRQPAFYFAQPV
jgi:hypothetical protein